MSLSLLKKSVPKGMFGTEGDGFSSGHLPFLAPVFSLYFLPSKHNAKFSISCHCQEMWCFQQNSTQKELISNPCQANFGGESAESINTYRKKETMHILG